MSVVDKRGVKETLRSDRADIVWHLLLRQFAGEDAHRWQCLAMFVLREEGWNLPQIGNAFGVHKGNVMRGIAKVKQQIHGRFAFALDEIPRRVPNEMREEYARATSLRQFYEDCRNGRWVVGRLARHAKNIARQLQALDRWEQHTRPRNWRGGDWAGPTLASLETTADLDDVWQRMLSAMTEQAVRATRGHLFSIMRRAVEVQAISRSPAGLRATPSLCAS